MIGIKNISDDVLKYFLDAIVKISNPKKIILFGSAVKPQKMFKNDLDFLIVVRNDASCREISKNLYNQITRMGYSLDLIVVTEKDMVEKGDDFWNVIYYARKEGREIYAA